MRALIRYALAGVMLSVGNASAQADPDSVQHRNDCRLAEQVIGTGNPRPHRAWAGTVIQTCGAETFTRATATGLQRLRTSSDTTSLRDVWGRALLYVNSQRVFDLGLEIAGDPSASAEARVFALMGVLRMLRPDEAIDVPTLTRTDRTGKHYRYSWCSDGRTAGIRQKVVGSPVDANARSRLREVGRSIVTDATNPAMVRAAAYCASVL